MADGTIEITRLSDLLLVVTKGEHTLRFKVNSSALRNASKVFDAMLSPEFAEGRALASQTSPDSLCEIKLEDDDAKCMEMILNVIHLQNSKVPERVDSNDVVNLAMLVDKYFLYDPMKLALSRWLVPTKDDDLHKFLQAAILLEHAQMFAATTKLLLLLEATTLTGDVCVGQDAQLVYFAGKIDNRRDFYRGKLLHSLHAEVVEHYSGSSCSYDRFTSSVIAARIRQLDVQTRSLRYLSLQDANGRAIHCFNDINHRPGSTFCSSSHDHINLADVKRNFTDEPLDVKGLCLHCIDREYNGLKEGTFKLGHSSPA